MEYYERRDDLDTPPFEQVELSPIQQVYEGACIFITGATGFLGKILMEKLLRTCNVGRIYILVRNKKGITPQERLAKLFDEKIFENLKLQKPGEVTKVATITGDCILPDLGLSEADKAKLADVNIIFHSAATLYMDQHLKTAYTINILATKCLLEFAKTLNKLQAFIYVSTAYTHAYQDLIEETFYDVILDEEEMGKLCSELDDTQIAAITPLLTRKWKNTYALTKACAENLVSKYEGILPIGVIRPSIVTSVWAEPLEGWNDNLNGVTGAALGGGLGILRVWCAKSRNVLDVIPVDTVINMMLAATWEVVTKGIKIKVYNCVSSTRNPFTMECWRIGDFPAESMKISSMKAIATTKVNLVANKTLFTIYSFWYHIIPAIFTDLLLQITGKPAQLLKVYIKAYNVNILLMPYCSEKPIAFTSDNVDHLWENLDPVDKILFNFDLKILSWRHFWLQAFKGIRVYMVCDPMDTLPEAQRLVFKMKIREYIIFSLIWISITYVFYFFLKDSIFHLL